MRYEDIPRKGEPSPSQIIMGRDGSLAKEIWEIGARSDGIYLAEYYANGAVKRISKSFDEVQDLIVSFNPEGKIVETVFC